MRCPRRLFALAAAAVLLAGGDALACGEKFLVSGRGTRYQRSKNARAASVLIYANPASGLPGTIGRRPLETVLKREGHRFTRVETLEELATLVAGGRFDVVLAATSVVEAVTNFVGGAADAPLVVALCVDTGRQQGPSEGAPCVKAPAKEGALLQAIDEAVARRERNLRRAHRSG